MAPVSLLARIAFILSILPLLLASPNNLHPSHPSSSSPTCPTITKTTTSPSCPTPTPSCPAPDCIYLSEISNPCGCPTSVATQNVYTPCRKGGGCDGACGTQWVVKGPEKGCSSTSMSSSGVVETYIPLPSPTKPATQTTPSTSKSTSISTSTGVGTTIETQPTTCATITASEGPACWTAGCPVTYSRCARQSAVTLSCGCERVETVTRCVRSCDGGCWTDWATKYLPCPMTPSLSWETRTGAVLTVPTLG